MYYNNYGNTSHVKYMVKAIIMKSKTFYPCCKIKTRKLLIIISESVNPRSYNYIVFYEQKYCYKVYCDIWNLLNLENIINV